MPVWLRNGCVHTPAHTYTPLSGLRLRDCAGSRQAPYKKKEHTMSITNYIVMALMGLWVVFWVLEIILKIRDSRFSRGCRHDDDGGFTLPFIKIGEPPPDNNKEQEQGTP